MGWDGTGNRERPAGWQRTRRQVWERDGRRCRECGERTGLLQGRCDHVIAWADGGGDEMSNLQWLCRPCHQVKSHAEAKARASCQAPKHPGAL